VARELAVRARVRRYARPLVRLLQALLAAILVAGVLAPNASVAVNAAVALLLTGLPGVLERDHGVTLGPGLTLWLAGAVTLHAVGMLGPYHDIWWWDHVTHTLTGTLVAGAGYATTVALDRHSEHIRFTSRFLFVYVLLFTLAFGVLWELLEEGARWLAVASGREPLLVQYGVADTMLDLIFDAVGAVLVATFGSRWLAQPVQSLTEALARS
jgi:hypothetical protein